MTRPGLRVLSIGALLCSAGCGTIPVQNYDYSANGTSEIMTYQAHFWDGHCATKPFHIRFIEKPANGTITIKQARKTIGERADLGTNNTCSGKSVMGKEVYYAAKEDFTGVDEFLIEISTTGLAEVKRTKITVDVK